MAIDDIPPLTDEQLETITAGKFGYDLNFRHTRLETVTNKYAVPASRMITGPLGRFTG